MATLSDSDKLDYNRLKGQLQRAHAQLPAGFQKGVYALEKLHEAQLHDLGEHPAFTYVSPQVRYMSVRDPFVRHVLLSLIQAFAGVFRSLTRRE